MFADERRPVPYAGVTFARNIGEGRMSDRFMLSPVSEAVPKSLWP